MATWPNKPSPILVPAVDKYDSVHFSRNQTTVSSSIVSSEVWSFVVFALTTQIAERPLAKQSINTYII